LNTLRSAQVRRISWVRGVGRLAVVGVASLKPSSVGRLAQSGCSSSQKLSEARLRRRS